MNSQEYLASIRVGDSIFASSEHSAHILKVQAVTEQVILADTGVLFSRTTGKSLSLPMPLTIQIPGQQTMGEKSGWRLSS